MKYRTLPLFPSKRSTSLPILLLFLSLINFLSVTCTYIYHTCNEFPTFTDGSSYARNLNSVMNDLFQNAPQSSGFNTSSHGQSPNKVYGLLQCTGNITAVSCSNCAQEANNTIKERCPNDIGGKLWLDDCFLRYGSSNFISILDTDGVSISNVNEIGSDIDAFHSTITILLSDLSNKAYIPANKGFAAGSANYSASGKLYGLVQCWRDISIQDCRKCFAKARPQLEYSTKQGAQVRYGSCMARYEVYSFFSSAQSPSHSPGGITPVSHIKKCHSHASSMVPFLAMVTKYPKLFRISRGSTSWAGCFTMFLVILFISPTHHLKYSWKFIDQVEETLPVISPNLLQSISVSNLGQRCRDALFQRQHRCCTKCRNSKLRVQGRVRWEEHPFIRIQRYTY